MSVNFSKTKFYLCLHYNDHENIQIKQRFSNLRRMIMTSWRHWETLKTFEKGKMAKNETI